MDEFHRVLSLQILQGPNKSRGQARLGCPLLVSPQRVIIFISARNTESGSNEKKKKKKQKIKPKPQKGSLIFFGLLFSQLKGNIFHLTSIYILQNVLLKDASAVLPAWEICKSQKIVERGVGTGHPPLSTLMVPGQHHEHMCKHYQSEVSGMSKSCSQPGFIFFRKERGKNSQNSLCADRIFAVITVSSSYIGLLLEPESTSVRKLISPPTTQ